MTPESSNKFYRSVIKTQSIAIVVLLGLAMLAFGWYMSRMDVVPSDIMQEVQIQGEITSQRYGTMQASIANLETKVDARSDLIESVEGALTAIQGKIEDHDARLRKIEEIITSIHHFPPGSPPAAAEEENRIE